MGKKKVIVIPPRKCIETEVINKNDLQMEFNQMMNQMKTFGYEPQFDQTPKATQMTQIKYSGANQYFETNQYSGTNQYYENFTLNQNPIMSENGANTRQAEPPILPRDKGTSLKNKWRSGQSFNSGVRSKTKESNSDRSQSDGSSGGIHDSGVASSTYSSDREKENRILETQFKIREKLSKVVKRAREKRAEAKKLEDESQKLLELGMTLSERLKRVEKKFVKKIIKPKMYDQNYNHDNLNEPVFDHEPVEQVPMNTNDRCALMLKRGNYSVSDESTEESQISTNTRKPVRKHKEPVKNIIVPVPPLSRNTYDKSGQILKSSEDSTEETESSKIKITKRQSKEKTKKVKKPIPELEPVRKIKKSKRTKSKPEPVEILVPEPQKIIKKPPPMKKPAGANIQRFLNISQQLETEAAKTATPTKPSNEKPKFLAKISQSTYFGTESKSELRKSKRRKSTRKSMKKVFIPEKKPVEIVKPDPKCVYQNPIDPFGKKEVYVPPPVNVKMFAQLFTKNIGLEAGPVPQTINKPETSKIPEKQPVKEIEPVIMEKTVEMKKPIQIIMKQVDKVESEESSAEESGDYLTDASESDKSSGSEYTESESESE